MQYRGDDVTKLLVERFASRRGISYSEATRWLVRLGLGLDPIGPWIDRRTITRAKKALSRTRRAYVRCDFPPKYEKLFATLKTKVGPTEARRLVLDQIKHDEGRAA